MGGLRQKLQGLGPWGQHLVRICVQPTVANGAPVFQIHKAPWQERKKEEKKKRTGRCHSKRGQRWVDSWQI